MKRTLAKKYWYPGESDSICPSPQTPWIYVFLWKVCSKTQMLVEKLEQTFSVKARKSFMETIRECVQTVIQRNK